MRRRKRANRPLGLLVSGLLGASVALLVSCGGSTKLIPLANSEPLQRDFEEVAHSAEAGHGSCSGTEAALAKTEQDYRVLPASVDPGLRRRLREGIEKLRSDALEMCVQPGTQTTTTTTTPRTTSTSTTPTTTATTTTQTTPTQTVPTTSSTSTTPPGGGTPAGEAEREGEEAREGRHAHESAPAGGATPGQTPEGAK